MRQVRIVGYGLCGPNEKYLEQTLKEFKRLCDDTIILCNNATESEVGLIKKYGFQIVYDNREWGKMQHVMKHEFVKNHVAKLSPDATICLDMDERFPAHVSREDFIKLLELGHSFYFPFVTLWDDGHNEDNVLWNIRLWKWSEANNVGPYFFEWEQKPLHCGLAPKWAYYQGRYANFPVIHYGLKDKADRERKYSKRYAVYDQKQELGPSGYYERLLTGRAVHYDEKEVCEIIKREVDSYRQSPKPFKIETTMSEEKQVLVRRKADGAEMRVPEYTLQDTLKQGFDLIDETVLSSVQIPKDSLAETTQDVTTENSTDSSNDVTSPTKKTAKKRK